MHAKNLFATGKIGCANTDLSVESSRSKKSWVQDVWAVGGGDQDHADVGVESIHFNKQLVEGLFALVVSATDTGTALTTNRIDFVNEDNRRRRGLGLLKKISYPGSSNTDKHFNKVRTRNREERNSGFAGYRFSYQGLSGSGWAI